jgi:hypothetical protein
MTGRAMLVMRGIKLATEIKRSLKQYLLLYEVNGAVVDQQKFSLVI